MKSNFAILLLLLSLLHLNSSVDARSRETSNGKQTHSKSKPKEEGHTRGSNVRKSTTKSSVVHRVLQDGETRTSTVSSSSSSSSSLSTSSSDGTSWSAPSASVGSRKCHLFSSVSVDAKQDVANASSCYASCEASKSCILAHYQEENRMCLVFNRDGAAEDGSYLVTCVDDVKATPLPRLSTRSTSAGEIGTRRCFKFGTALPEENSSDASTEERCMQQCLEKVGCVVAQFSSGGGCSFFLESKKETQDKVLLCVDDDEDEAANECDINGPCSTTVEVQLPTSVWTSAPSTSVWTSAPSTSSSSVPSASHRRLSEHMGLQEVVVSVTEKLKEVQEALTRQLASRRRRRLQEEEGDGDTTPSVSPSTPTPSTSAPVSSTGPASASSSTSISSSAASTSLEPLDSAFLIDEMNAVVALISDVNEMFKKQRRTDEAAAAAFLQRLNDRFGSRTFRNSRRRLSSTVPKSSLGDMKSLATVVQTIVTKMNLGDELMKKDGSRRLSSSNVIEEVRLLTAAVERITRDIEGRDRVRRLQEEAEEASSSSSSATPSPDNAISIEKGSTSPPSSTSSRGGTLSSSSSMSSSTRPASSTSSSSDVASNAAAVTAEMVEVTELMKHVNEMLVDKQQSTRRRLHQRMTSDELAAFARRLSHSVDGLTQRLERRLLRRLQTEGEDTVSSSGSRACFDLTPLNMGDDQDTVDATSTAECEEFCFATTECIMTDLQPGKGCVLYALEKKNADDDNDNADFINSICIDAADTSSDAAADARRLADAGERQCFRTSVVLNETQGDVKDQSSCRDACLELESCVLGRFKSDSGCELYTEYDSDQNEVVVCLQPGMIPPQTTPAPERRLAASSNSATSTSAPFCVDVDLVSMGTQLPANTPDTCHEECKSHPDCIMARFMEPGGCEAFVEVEEEVDDVDEVVVCFRQGEVRDLEAGRSCTLHDLALLPSAASGMASDAVKCRKACEASSVCVLARFSDAKCDLYADAEKQSDKNGGKGSNAGSNEVILCRPEEDDEEEETTIAPSNDSSDSGASTATSTAKQTKSARR